MRLVAAFLYIGTISLGQGRSSYFHDEFVRRRRWVTDAEFLEGVSVCQVLPGPQVTNLSAYFGHQLGGPLGAALGTLAICLPGALSILALGILYFNGLPADFTGPVGRGIGATAVGLVLATLWRTGRPVMGSRRGVVLALVTFVLFALLKLNIFIVLALVAPVALWWYWPRAVEDRP
jgi:chromate transporter